MKKRIAIAAVAYLVPTFILGFIWHLVVFERRYAALAMYRHDVIIPFGFLSMSIQALFFAWLYEVAISPRFSPRAPRMIAYGAMGAALSWSFTTLAVAAKNVMTSVPDYLAIETAFTALQWALVAPLTTLVLGTRRPLDDEDDRREQLAR